MPSKISSEEVLRGRNRVLQELARGAPLPDVLDALVTNAEQVFPTARAAVLLVDAENGRLHEGVAPSMPAFYREAVEGIEVRPGLGACPEAAATGRRVVCEDVPTHPNWEGLRDLARRAEIGACWSEPVLSTTGEVLATFALYHAEPCAPHDKDLRFLETNAQVAGIAIEHARALERIRDSEELFRQLAENIREVFWLTDWAGMEVLYVSPAYEAIWGRSRESLLVDPTSWSYDVHPEDRERVVRAFAENAERGMYDEEYRVVREDGTVRWIHDRAFPICDAEGRVYRMAGLSEDVTEHKQIELSLRRSVTTFRQLAENIRGIFWLSDWERREVLYVSPAWESIWGRPAKDLLDDASCWREDLHPDDRDRVVAAFERDAPTGDYDVDYRIVRPDGSVRWIHERAFPVEDESGEVRRVAGIAEDITGRKRVELELRQARDELDARRRSQVESLTSQLLLAEERERRKLAQDLHDGMNQTITLALLELAQLRESAPPELRERLGRIEGLIDEANRSTRSLTFQLSPPILHDLGFEPAVQWLVEDVQHSHGLEVELIEPEEPTPLDERVRVLLFRAVRELLINVAKHADARRVRVVLERGDLEMRIAVEDDGVAFDPESVGSRGLGLFGIRERLTHLGGSMRIRSRPDVGTRVTLTAPCRQPNDEPVKET